MGVLHKPHPFESCKRTQLAERKKDVEKVLTKGRESVIICELSGKLDCMSWRAGQKYHKKLKKLLEILLTKRGECDIMSKHFRPWGKREAKKLEKVLKKLLTNRNGCAIIARSPEKGRRPRGLGRSLTIEQQEIKYKQNKRVRISKFF